MNKWLALPDNTKRNAYIQIAEKRGMNPFVVEKDWWVVQTLAVIFEMEVSKHLVFKGGTSLSKAWGLIERFSEDIDLAIDREFLGFTDELSRTKITELRKAASSYVSNDFLNELKGKFEEKGFIDVQFNLVEAQDSDQDPRIIEIFYPNLMEASEYLKPKVQAEIGCRSLREPNTVRSFTSLVNEEYSDRDFVQPAIKIPTVNPERTFLEKIFLLHEEFHKPIDKIRVDRLSRHLYDVYHLAKTEYAEKALNDNELYETIVEHRYKYTRVGGVNYNLLQPETINPIPIQEVIKYWEADYNKMFVHMIYQENAPTFDEIINELKNLKNRINALPWRFKKEFPLKKNNS